MLPKVEMNKWKGFWCGDSCRKLAAMDFKSPVSTKAACEQKPGYAPPHPPPPSHSSPKAAFILLHLLLLGNLWSRGIKVLWQKELFRCRLMAICRAARDAGPKLSREPGTAHGFQKLLMFLSQHAGRCLGGLESTASLAKQSYICAFHKCCNFLFKWKPLKNNSCYS